jgi:cysteine desulfurase
VDYVAAQAIENAKRLRAMSPLYEMAQSGIDMKTAQWAAR